MKDGRVGVVGGLDEWEVLLEWRGVVGLVVEEMECREDVDVAPLPARG